MVEPTLFQRFPALRARLPWQPLADLPTPVTALEGDLEGIWVKRDDLTGERYGGNKTRKLAFVLADAVARGKRHVVTFGGLGTHHGLATALHCESLGLDCTVLLFDQPVTGHVRDNLLAMRAAGARLVYVGGLAAAFAAFHAHPARLRRDHLFLHAGASVPLGALAYVDAALELDAQIADGELPEPGRIVVATGSVGTQAGLALGLALAGRAIPVLGVRVMPDKLGPFDACTPAMVTDLIDRTRRTMRALGVPELDREPLSPWLTGEYLGGGYGVPTDAGTAALERAHGHGLSLDPTYTAKAFAAALDSRDETDGPVLFWHTLSAHEPARRAAVEALPGRLRRRLSRAR